MRALFVTLALAVCLGCDGRIARSYETDQPANPNAPAAAWDPVRQRILLFGGQLHPEYSNETWTFDGQSWTKHAVEGPPARSRASLVWHPERAVLVLFGGFDIDWGQLRDTWTWDGESWEELPVGTSTIRAQADALMTWDGSRLLLFDGSDGPERGLWTLTTAGWERYSP